ncbi:hypothetical protein [Kitasatospora sp. NPDC059817]|uniref:hypothetical protein n=1 Tax=Kitasatospora sp. NPDC059817 TaxID=3346961 RepID=UPI003653B38E
MTMTQEQISRLTGLTVRAISTCLKDLTALGELSRESGWGASKPSSYSILLVSKSAGAPPHADAGLPTPEPDVPQSSSSFLEESSRKNPAAASRRKSLHGEPEVTSRHRHGGITPFGSNTTKKQASFAGPNLREVPAGQDSVEVPDGSSELVAAMTAAGMVVGWRLTGAEWERVTALSARWGHERLVEMVARRWNVERPPLSARYLLRIWADLPDQAPEPAGQTNVVPLRRQPGSWVPFQNTAQSSAYQNGF